MFAVCSIAANLALALHLLIKMKKKKEKKMAAKTVVMIVANTSLHHIDYLYL